MKLYELQTPEKVSKDNTPSILYSMVAQDQQERNAYQQFVQSKADGDWDKGAKMWAQTKQRPVDDIFGDTQRLKQFAAMRFDFTQFNDKDWNNYWLLAQHADSMPNVQKAALKNIVQHLGTDNQYYRYLKDRITCRERGTQQYNTQDICQQQKTSGKKK